MQHGFEIARSDHWIELLPQMANRHGLIAGATGTGKTVTLRVMAEKFSAAGVPVFMADVKGDLGGLAYAGGENPKIRERASQLGLSDYQGTAYPAVFWDVFGKEGHPVRATISDLGPMLLSRLLNLNETQSAVLTIAFKAADEEGMLLLDMKDLKAMLQFIAEHSSELQAEYGNISQASVGAIQRGLVALEEQGVEGFFGEPALNIADLLQVASDGRGVINILSATRLMEFPRAYSTLLLWLLAELYENLPEAGDLDKPKLVFFFDEAHLLFDEAPAALRDKIEQVVRLIRSKGVGIYFVTQNPLDIPDDVLGQLGNRVQHALRAFTPRDQKSVKAAAQTFRNDSGLDVEKVITELGVGEALVSFLDEQGAPGSVQRALIAPPHSMLSAITPAQRESVMRSSVLFGHYERAVDRESAYEKLKERAQKLRDDREAETQRSSPSAGRRRQGPIEAMIVSASRSIGSSIGRQIMRGVLGSLLGGRR